MSKQQNKNLIFFMLSYKKGEKVYKRKWIMKVVKLNSFSPLLWVSFVDNNSSL